MSRRQARATQADIGRAVRVAKQFGMMVEITSDGTIRIVPIRSEQTGKLEYDREIVL